MPLWEAHFPQLGKWIKSSERTDSYNCAAFAAGEDTQKWDPYPPGVHFWPSGLNRGYSVQHFVEAYRTIGYDSCADGMLDPYFEKIVLYTNNYGGVEHVARQLSDGSWTSKMGDEEDIIHENPQALSGGYGHPTVYMQRVLRFGEHKDA